MKNRRFAALITVIFLLQSAGKAAYGGGDNVRDLTALAAALTALAVQYEIDLSKRSDVWGNEKSLHETNTKELPFDVAVYALDHIGITDGNTVWNDYAAYVAGLYNNYLYKNPGRELSFGTGVPRSDFDATNPGYDELPDPSKNEMNYPSAYKKRADDLRNYAKNVMAGNKQEVENLADSIDPNKSTREISKIYDALFGLSASSPSSKTSSSISAGGLGNIIGSLLDQIPTGIGDLSVTTYRAALQAGARAGSLNSPQIEALDRLVAHWHGQGSVHLAGGIVVRRKCGKLEFRAIAPRGDPDGRSGRGN